MIGIVQFMKLIYAIFYGSKYSFKYLRFRVLQFSGFKNNFRVKLLNLYLINKCNFI